MSSIAFVDDLIIYLSGTNPSLIKNKLENLVATINNLVPRALSPEIDRRYY